MICVTCGRETEMYVNIALKRTPMCNDCTDSITLQNVRYLIDNQKV